MHFDIEPHTIFQTITGSHAYGMATPESDIDTKGVAISPKSTVLGFAYNFAQKEQLTDEVDSVVYDLRKFMKLATQNNPNIIEIMFISPDHWQETSPYWNMLWDNRDRFLGKGCYQKYTGYAHAQLKRINTHRKWLLDPPTKKPLREDYGLPEHKKLTNSERGALNALVEEGFTVGAEFMTYLVNEKKYQSEHNHWKQYQQWKKSRNKVRAELEAKFGYDTKHASHLIRLMRQCIEILEKHTLTIGDKDNAEQLLAVRRGAFSYDAVMEEAESLQKKCEALYESSTLRTRPDLEWANGLCVEIQEIFWDNNPDLS